MQPNATTCASPSGCDAATSRRGSDIGATASPAGPPRWWCLSATHAASGVAVAAHRHVQHDGTPPEWFVRLAPGQRVARGGDAAPAVTPVVRLDNLAGEYGTVGFNSLSGHLHTERVEAAQRRQVRTSEGGICNCDGLGLRPKTSTAYNRTSTTASIPSACTPGCCNCVNRPNSTAR